MGEHAEMWLSATADRKQIILPQQQSSATLSSEDPVSGQLFRPDRVAVQSNMAAKETFLTKGI